MAIKLGTNQDNTLDGTKRSDYIFGLDGNDILNGLDGSDWLFGGNGDDNLLGGNGNDYLDGGSGNDTLNGGAGKDILLGSEGSDNFIGGDGIDIADYASFTQGITLRFEYDYTTTSTSPFTSVATPALRVGKDNLLPPISSPTTGNRDTLDSVETIVGGEGQTNTINFAFQNAGVSRGAFIPATSAPAIKVDLAAQTLTYGETTLTVKNFTNVIGSPSNDILLGDEKANVLDGLTGGNQLDGRGGDDTLRTFENDILTGGDGADQFTLRASWKFIGGRSGLSFQRITPSTITDFAPGVDTLAVDRGTFNGSIPIDSESTLTYNGFNYGDNANTLATGRLDAENFVVLGNGSITSQTIFAYDGSTGELFYLTGYFSMAKVAILEGAPTLSANDIQVI